ncbi:MAG: hypothetical protein HQL90_04255 [Magnetococcales bacterium]|nr:hypothetical protein [Magnetococcales bacterium]
MSVRLLDGVTATGASSAVKVKNAMQHAVQANFTNSGGSVTALTVDLEGTINNQGEIDAATAVWFQLASHAFTAGELSAQAAQFTVAVGPERYIRANITTLTETGTTAVYVRHQAYDGGDLRN